MLLNFKYYYAHYHKNWIFLHNNFLSINIHLKFINMKQEDYLEALKLFGFNTQVFARNPNLDPVALSAVFQYIKEQKNITQKLDISDVLWLQDLLRRTDLKYPYHQLTKKRKIFEVLVEHIEEAFNILLSSERFDILVDAEKEAELINLGFIDQVCQCNIQRGVINRYLYENGYQESLIKHQDWKTFAYYGDAAILLSHQQYQAMATTSAHPKCLKALLTEGKEEFILQILQQKLTQYPDIFFQWIIKELESFKPANQETVWDFISKNFSHHPASIIPLFRSLELNNSPENAKRWEFYFQHLDSDKLLLLKANLTAEEKSNLYYQAKQYNHGEICRALRPEYYFFKLSYWRMRFYKPAQ